MTQRRKMKTIPFRNDAEMLFKISMRYVEKRKLGRALVYIKRAVEKEPFNADYLFNLACIYTEQGEIKKSCEVLSTIIENVDPTFSECYFGIACNYFDSGNFKRAKEYFERYLVFAPNGQFAGDVHDILEYLCIYEDIGGSVKRDKVADRLFEEGLQSFYSGNLRRARIRLKKAIEIKPEAIPPRNSLSLVYFYSGEIDRAISLAKSVIKLQPKNDCAHCYQALFYVQKNQLDLYDQTMKKLSKIKIRNRDEIAESLTIMLNSEAVGKPVKEAARKIMALQAFAVPVKPAAVKKNKEKR